MTQTAPLIGSLVITPRPMGAYRDMFLLTDEELRAGPILDCPGGSSPFGAQARRKGANVVSIDPTYSRTPQDLAEQIDRDLDYTMTWVGENPNNFDWGYLGSLSAFRQMWEVSAELFLADYSPDSEHYVAAELPTLPFEDQTFALTLSSHLLFCYGSELGYDWHLAALRELVRVTSGEVRLFPLIDTAGTRFEGLAKLRAELAADGVDTEIRMAKAAYVAGGSEMLACWRR